jgi:RimJ/RimL family protein N-acetyltransferase
MTALVAPAPVAVEIRAMQADDAAALVRFHASLSPHTTYLRFFSIHPELTPQEVERFPHVDHREREALVAVADGSIVGVGRFDRIPGSPDAEVAFVVADSWQGRGVGTVLFRSLLLRARQLGVERFTADTLAHNRRMLNLFHRCGLPVTSRFDGDVVRVVIDLAAADDTG